MFFDYNRTKLDIVNRKITPKSTNIWNLSNILLNKYMGQRINHKEAGKYVESNENENTTSNLWDAARTVVRKL